MNPATAPQPALTASEWSIVIDLLEREHAALPNEIHHTKTRGLRTELEQRLEVVANLLNRLNPQR